MAVGPTKRSTAPLIINRVNRSPFESAPPACQMSCDLRTLGDVFPMVGQLTHPLYLTKAG